MSPSYTLAYYDQIFGARSPAYDELLRALSAELTDYAQQLGPTLASGDPTQLRRLRHSHRPLVENLRLTRLRALEDELQRAFEAGVSGPALVVLGDGAAQEARSVALELTSELTRSSPEPQ